MIEEPSISKYYDMQIHSITEERDFLKARVKVLEDDKKAMSEALGNALSKLAKKDKLIKEIKNLVNEMEES